MIKIPTTSKSANLPKLRFPGFGGVWEEKRFVNIYRFLKTNSLSRAELDEFGDIVNIHYGDIHKSNKSHFNISKERLSFLKTTEVKNDFVQDGDLIIADASEDRFDVGKTIEVLNIGDKKVVSGLHTLLARPEEKELGFFGFLMRTQNIKRQLWRIATGASVLGISKTEVGKVKINLPPLPEQQKIASFLGSVDEWIANLRVQKENIEHYKKGIMQQIFSRQIRFKDENRKDFPAWEEKRLGEIGKSYNGLVGKNGGDFGEGEPFITYKQIFDSSELDISKFAFVKIVSNEKQNRAQFGDIFFTTSSETPLEVGFASVLLNKKVSPFLNSFSFGFRFNSLKEFDPYFAKFFFRTSIFRREVVKLAQGSTRYNISKLDFMKMKFKFPSFSEQQKIANFLTSIDNLIESKQQQITYAEAWKKGLMQGLFV